MSVAVELHVDLVKIVLAAVDRQFGAPPVLNSLKAQAAPRADLGNSVRAAAQRRLISGGLEVATFPVVLRQHRQFTEAQDEKRVTGTLENKTYADRKSTRLNSSHSQISYAVFC